jgi:hypothetical protein
MAAPEAAATGLSTAAILALATPVFALLVRLLGKWAWKRLTGQSQLEDTLDENRKVVADGDDDDINRVLDERVR